MAQHRSRPWYILFSVLVCRVLRVVFVGQGHHWYQPSLNHYIRLKL